MADDKITDRVVKLLRKAESTTSPEEAEAFTEKAVELMERHAITGSDLDARDGRSGKMGFASAGVSGEYAPQVMDVWAMVGEALGFVTVVHLTDQEVRWYGYQSDLDLAEMLWESLMTQMTGALLDYVEGLRWAHTRVRMSDQRSFVIGWGMSVAVRIKASRTRAREEATEHGLTPVLVNREDRVKQWADENLAYPVGNPLTTSISNMGFREGRNAGDDADIGGTRIRGFRGELG